MRNAVCRALLIGVLGAFLLPACANPSAVPRFRAAPVHALPVRLYQTNYRGWRNAFRLSNGIVEIVVVPAIGRIMAYQFAGQPQTNVLWNNPALLGKPLPYAAPYPPRATSWVNYGGDKLWPAPQSDWPQAQRQTGNWPPDPQMDYGPYAVSRIPNGLRLTSPLSDNRGIRTIRDIVLRPGSARVSLRETFQAPAPVGGNVSGPPILLPLSLWNIAQARPDATVFVPLRQGSHFAQGYAALDGKLGASNWQVSDGMLSVVIPKGDGDKAGVDAPVGWIGAWYGGSVLFTEQYALGASGAYPDQNTPLQVWSQSGTESYLEMEALGPLSPIGAGQRQTRTLFWNLRRLSPAPRSRRDAHRILRGVMQADTSK